MVIDSHTHIFPQMKSQAILSKLSSRAAIPHFTDGTLQGLLNSMKTAGIHLSLISRITTRPEQVGPINRWLYGLRRENVLPMATIHPDMPAGQAYIKSLKDKGFIGIKVHPDYQGFYADDKRMYPFYEALQDLKMPILFHAGLDRGLSPPFRAMPVHLLKVHRQFPGLVMIAAHMGGEDNYDQTETCLLGEDIYLDTAFVLRLMDPDTLKRFFQNASYRPFFVWERQPVYRSVHRVELFTEPSVSKPGCQRKNCGEECRRTVRDQGAERVR